MKDSALIISATAPVPVDNGKRAVLNGLLTYLVERLGPDNVHYAILMAKDEELPPMPGIVHRLSRPGIRSQVAAMRNWVTNRSYTLQEAMLASATLHAEIHGLIDRIRPSIEVFDTLRLAQHTSPHPHAVRRILYLDDLFSVRYQRLLDVAAGGTLDVDPLGGFVDNVPARLRAVARRRAVYTRLLRSERDRIRRREAQVVRLFDVSLLVNSREVGELRERSGTDKVTRLTPMLPLPQSQEHRPAEPMELVYLGKLNIPHNDDAICNFVQTTMPEVWRRQPAARLRVIGKNPSTVLRRLAAQHPGVVLEGFVEDLDEVFGRATAVIAPLRFGSGVKIKVLEALGRGTPVVATSVAAEGITVAPDGADGCIVEDDLTRWPGILAGMTDPFRSVALSRAAVDFYRRTYAPDVVTAQYDEIFGLSEPSVERHREAG